MTFWTEDYRYEEMSALTNLSMSGKCSKETKQVIREHCDALFMEMYDDGVDCEGWEPNSTREYLRQW
jgi:hypothetical protein